MDGVRGVTEVMMVIDVGFGLGETSASAIARGFTELLYTDPLNT